MSSVHFYSLVVETVFFPQYAHPLFSISHPLKPIFFHVSTMSSATLAASTSDSDVDKHSLGVIISYFKTPKLSSLQLNTSNYLEIVSQWLHKQRHRRGRLGGRRHLWEDVHAVELFLAPLDDVGQACLDLRHFGIEAAGEERMHETCLHCSGLSH